VIEWTHAAGLNALPDMPYLGRVVEVITERLRNADDAWEGNDLNDVHFLTCTAGYADVVVGERKTSEYLRRAEGLVPKGAFVCRTLPEAIEHLRGGRSTGLGSRTRSAT
jgi:hypothetical protein